MEEGLIHTNIESDEAQKKASLYPILALAYLGDAVLEILVRERLLEKGLAQPKDLVNASKSYVTLEAQSDAFERLLPHLNQAEEAVLKRGRNAKTHSTPKHGDRIQYRRATALEALFGYLHMARLEERKRELFNVAFGE